MCKEIQISATKLTNHVCMSDKMKKSVSKTKDKIVSQDVLDA